MDTDLTLLYERVDLTILFYPLSATLAPWQLQEEIVL